MGKERRLASSRCCLCVPRCEFLTRWTIFTKFSMDVTPLESIPNSYELTDFREYDEVEVLLNVTFVLERVIQRRCQLLNYSVSGRWVYEPEALVEW